MGGARPLFGLRSDGCEFPIEASISRFQSHSEWQSTVIFRDITERMQAEATQARLMHILDSSLNEVYVFDAESLRFEYANQGALRNLGYSLKAMQGMTPVDLKPEFTEASFRQVIAPLIRHEQAQYRFETVHRRADGSLYPMEGCLQLVEYENKRVFLGIILDITQRKAAETVSRYNEEQYRQLFEKSMDAVLQTTPDGGILTANPAACALFALTEQEIIHRGRAGMVDTSDPRLAVLLQVRAATGSARGELRMRRGDDSLFDAEISSSIYQDPRGGSMASLLIRDVTERNQAQAALIAAKEAAESANVAKSQFLATMSHEIRTPLNVIKGMAYAMRRTGLAPKQEECLAHINTAAAHLLSIVSNVLDLAKIEAGKFEMEHDEINVGQVAADTVDMLRGNAHQKNIKLAIEIQAVTAPLLGDATKLRQALLNYLSNALKFTEAGTITLRVLAEQESDSHTLLRFAVHDTGIGINADTAARLFTPFEQADNSDTRQHGGTGLGLVITKRIAQLMGGSAGVDSVPGVGSTFWFTARLHKPIPASRPAVATVAVAQEAGLSPVWSPEQILQRDFSGTRILLAEDEPTTRMIFLDLLEELGLIVDTATDGTFAVDKAANHAYALIVMDMQMPKMSGLQATRLIRATAAGQQVPIIMLTGNVFEETKTLCLAAGANDFINKPVEPEDLFALILKWLTVTPAPHAPQQLRG